MVVDQIVRSGSRAPNLHGQAASLASRTDVEQEFALLQLLPMKMRNLAFFCFKIRSALKNEMERKEMVCYKYVQEV